MSSFAPLLQAFFTERLLQQRHASPHTVAAYRDAFRLVLSFALQELGKAPSDLELTDLDAPFVTRFLSHLDKARKNSARTRNARLAAIHSFFRYVSLREPRHSALIQRVLAIPHKRAEKKLVAFLARPEYEALLVSPDQGTRLGRRDHALLSLAIQTGLRVSEITHLRIADIQLHRSGSNVRCHGKGRKERITPLTAHTISALRAYLKDREASPDSPFFVSRLGNQMSRDAVERLIAKHRARAAKRCPTLSNKHISPHVLRHTNAMLLLESGLDRSVIALWLGHESIETTEVYLHANLATKEKAIAKTAPPGVGQRRYRPADRLLAFLESL
jgi:site-specific recombinase XerD